MNKKTIAAADFERKPYAKPQMKVAVIEEADIICTSDKAAFSVDEGTFGDEEDW